MSEHRRHDVGVVHLAPGDRHGPAEPDELPRDGRPVFKNVKGIRETRHIGKGINHRHGFGKKLWARHDREILSQDLPADAKSNLVSG